jgi:stage II sporulation protein D
MSRYRVTTALLLALFIAGCAAAPPIRDEGAPAARGADETFEEIRIAVLQYDRRVGIFVEEGTVEAGDMKLSLQSPQTLYADGATLQYREKRVPLPVTIRSDRPIVLENKSYYGHLFIKDGYVINIVPIDVYTIGVLNGEVPASWPIEALKAQAVVSRTYAYNRILQHRDELFDAGSTVMYQKYEYGGGSTAIEEAVMGTKDEVLLFGNEPIEVFFHSCSGGRTESARDVFQEDLPYLRSVPDPYCAHDERFSWSFRVDARLMGRTLKSLGVVDDPGLAVRDVRIAERTGSGRVKAFLVLLEDGGQVTVDGNRLRLALDPTSFKSLLITEIVREKTPEGISFLFQGRGYGHGVGMSQWGAREMAEQGFSYRKILAHYYPGTRIGRVWDIR